MELLSAKIIKNSILENYIEYQYLFVEFQSNFLLSLYSRYYSIENGNLVLFFAKETHQDILRQRDYDPSFNLSYDKFWENHSEINPKKNSINKIAKEIFLPKETARRKILQLTKQKVLNKKDKNIGWLPNDKYKKSYNLVVDKEISDVCKLINFICKRINHSISREEITKELKAKFSFYWFHFLEAELKYLKLWNQQLKDPELILIFLQVVHLFRSKAKVRNLSHSDIFDKPSITKEFISSSISATSISEITKIPRATCVRKLEFLVKLKIVSQDEISKRYYVSPTALEDSLISPKITEKIAEVFSDFFFICIRAINAKT